MVGVTRAGLSATADRNKDAVQGSNDGSSPQHERMKATIVTAILSAAAAFAAATWVYRPVAVNYDDDAPLHFDRELPGEERLAALERAVSQEQVARQLLQDEVMLLTDELERLQAPLRDETSPDREAATAEQAAARAESRRQRFARRNDPQFRAQRLVDAGIAPGVADWIVRREEELQMESLRAQFEAERSNDPGAFFQRRSAGGDTLRSEIGDADYERYLQANGRSTRIGVSSVLGSSPAQSAGVLPGDEIVRYDGERVFSINDIHDVAKVGEQGQSVVMEILRDGQMMQIVIPRGPLGITGGRRRR